MKEYHIIIQGVQSGPFQESTIQSMIFSGELNHDDLCWTTGMSEWQPIHTVTSLSQSGQEQPMPEQSAPKSQTQSELNPNEHTPLRKRKVTPGRIAAVIVAAFVGVICVFKLIESFSVEQQRIADEKESGLFATYPVIGENLAQTKKRLKAQDKQPEPSKHPGLSTITTVTPNFKHIIMTFFSEDTVVAFYCFPFKKYMDGSEQRIMCTGKHAANVQDDITSVYHRTKGMTTKGGEYYDGLDRKLIFIQYDDGTLLASAEKYLAAMGVEAYTVTFTPK